MGQRSGFVQHALYGYGQVRPWVRIRLQTNARQKPVGTGLEIRSAKKPNHSSGLATKMSPVITPNGAIDGRVVRTAGQPPGSGAATSAAVADLPQ